MDKDISLTQHDVVGLQHIKFKVCSECLDPIPANSVTCLCKACAWRMKQEFEECDEHVPTPDDWDVEGVIDDDSKQLAD